VSSVCLPGAIRATLREYMGPSPQRAPLRTTI